MSCLLSAQVARRVGDRGALARALMNLGAIAQRRGLLDDAIARLDESLAISREIGPPGTQAAALSYLASAYAAPALPPGTGGDPVHPWITRVLDAAGG
jgi:hypothetical protein